MIIDSHAHLNDEKLINEFDDVVLRMLDNNVKIALIPGWNIESSTDAVKLSNKSNYCFAAVGIHPENIDGLTLDDIEKIEELAKDKKVIAIGECGLDYHWRTDNKEEQKKFLNAQLVLANKLNLPIIIHSRDCTEDILKILKEHVSKYGKRANLGVFHSFSGSTETMKEVLKLGFYVSFSGPVTFKNAPLQKEAAKMCPLDKILTETDSPYMTPVPFRGERNEPKNVKYVLETIAELKEMDAQELENIVENNFNKLFNLEVK